MKIGNREIGPGQPPYIVCEIGANHCGELAYALELVHAAKECGADAVKLQAYTPDTITLKCDREEFTVAEGPWKGRNLYDLYEKTQTPFKWFPRIAEEAHKIGITWFASCFDISSIDLIVHLGAPAIKIASFEIIDIPLIRYAAATGLPLIISTGMANIDEIEAALLATEKANGRCFLHCVSGYPTPAAESNLARLGHWSGASGVSDHSTGPEIPIAATALGACLIEKHFRLSWHPITEDTPFSLDEVEFFEMTRQVRNTWAAMQPTESRSEAAQRPLRRSLFAVADIKAGEVFSSANVRSIRPGNGLAPKHIDDLIGQKVWRDVARGEPIVWSMLADDQSRG